MSAEPAALRERRALAVAHGAAALVLVGAFVLPTLANLAAFALVASFAGMPSARERLRRVLATSLARAALLLLAVLAAATLWSEAPWLERFRAWWDWRPLLLLIAAAAVFGQAQARQRALLVFIAAAALGAAWSFWAWAHGYSTVANNHDLNGIVLRNPVTQGMAFTLAGFFAAMFALRGNGLDRRLRIALALAAGLLLTNLLFVTSGRSAHLLLLIVAAVTAVRGLRGWRRWAAVVVLPVVALLAYAASPMLQARFGLLTQELRAPLAGEQLTAMGIRTVMWTLSAELARERPVLGYGMAGIGPAYAQAVARSGLTGWAATPTRDPHNQYLQVQLQAGLVGSAAFIAFLVAALRHRAREPERTWATAILLGWCATSLATSHFTTFAEAHLLMTLLGVLLAVEDPDRAGPAPR